MKKPLCWAERLGHQISVRESHCRSATAVREGESSAQTVQRMGFRVVGGFTQDVNVPSRSTALVVRK